MRPVRLAGAIADPQEMRGAGIGVVGQTVHTGQRLLVGQQQGLVAGVEIGFADLRRAGRIDAAGRHEAQRFVDPVRQVLIAIGQRRAGDEAEVPAMDLVQIGIAAGGEGAQQVERAGRLEIAELHACGVGNAGLGGEVGAVDDIAAIGRQGHAVLGFVVRGAGLGELAGHAADFHDRHRGAEGEHHRHLQQHAEGVADDVGGEILEALGAIPALQHDGPPFGDFGQRGLEAACLAGEHERRIGAQAGFLGGELGRIRIGGLLLGFVVAPGIEGPGGHHITPEEPGAGHNPPPADGLSPRRRGIILR